MRFIINGRAGAGKDVIADYMVEEYGFTKITFAAGIYEIARNTFGMTTKDTTNYRSKNERDRSRCMDKTCRAKSETVGIWL